MKKPSLKIPNTVAVAFLGLVVLFTVINPPQNNESPNGEPNSRMDSSTNRQSMRGPAGRSPASQPTGFWASLLPQAGNRRPGAQGVPKVRPGDPAAEEQNRAIFRLEMIEELKHLARYPDSSTPIWGENDTLASEYSVYKNVVTPQTKDAPPVKLAVWTSKAFYLFPDIPIIQAQITDTREQPLPGKVSALLVRENGQEFGRIQLNDVGSGKDAIAGDGIYTGSPEFTLNQEALLAGNYTVVVHATQFAGDTELKTTTGFLWSSPGGLLTGRYRDSSDGDFLTVEAEVRITTPGRFHLQASLYSLGDRPLAWAQNAGEFKPGTYWIALKYYGLIFRELNADGPYVLKGVALSRTGIEPNMKGPLIESAHKTSAYAASQFTNKPFGNPNYLDQIGQLEQDEKNEKGQSNP